MKKANEIFTLTQAIGKTLIESAHEAYSVRIDSMKSNTFDEVIKATKNKDQTGQNKANGYYVSDAVRYLDNRLENEYNEVWLEIDDICSEDWFKAVEQFRW